MINESRWNRRDVPDRITDIFLHHFVYCQPAVIVFPVIELPLSEDQNVLVHNVCAIVCGERSLDCYSESVQPACNLIPYDLLMKIPITSRFAQALSKQMGEWYHGTV